MCLRFARGIGTQTHSVAPGHQTGSQEVFLTSSITA